MRNPAIRYRARIEAAIERLIAMLDQIDGDDDLEEGADAEPSLGSIEREPHEAQLSWGAGGLAGLEMELANA